MTITAVDLDRIVRGRIGLIIGPDVTHHPGILEELSASVAKQYQVEQGKTFLETGESAIQAGHSADDLRQHSTKFLAAQSPSALTGQLANVRWSAIFSASIDQAFEDKLRQEYDRSAIRPEVIVLSDLTQSIPPKYLPIFKLLGGAERDNVVCSEVDYHQRRATWRNAVKIFTDLVKDAPVLCLGMAGCPWVLRDLLVEMMSNPIGPVAHLLLLEHDGLTTDPALTRLLAHRTQIVPVKASLGEVVRAVETVQTRGPSAQPPLPSKGLFDQLSTYGSFAVIVNHCLSTDVKREERQRLLDLLFSPSVPRWDPFVHGLDFARTATGRFLDEVRRHLATLQPHSPYNAAVLTGAVASGKTVVLKRIAFDLATNGHLVVWLKPSHLREDFAELQEFFQAVSRIKEYRSRPVVVCMDDPLTYGGLTPKAVITAARPSGMNVLLCVSVRTSEAMIHEADELYAGLPLVAEVSLDDVLDADEWARLPQYLVELGVELDLASAEAEVANVESRNARDTLSVLYFLLPGTKAIISSAIKDEFFRLGDTAGLTNILVGVASRSSRMLKDAYEMVAVSGKIGVRLPIEILVSALGVSYSDWLAVANTRGPVWGFLYSDAEDDTAATSYRPRNAIVTDIIINAVNGGTIGHSGEARVLAKLLGSCTGSQLVYRDYCVEVLSGKAGLSKFDFDEGLKLFDAAIDALPYEDRTILHQKGLWLKNRGRDPVNADRVLRDALAAKKYPYAANSEPDEHIYTSLAATALDAIDERVLTLQEGTGVVREHLAKARARQWSNYKAVHVQANLASRLAGSIPVEHKADVYNIVTLAVADIDRALLLLQNPLDDLRYADNAVHLLQTAREEVLANVGSVDEIKTDATKEWSEHGRQEAFAIAARKLYQKAKQSNKGSDYKTASDYCKDAIQLVRAAGREPIASLADVMMEIHYHWQVRRSIECGSGSVIDWDTIQTMATLVLQSGDASAPFYRYVQALALSHLGRWGDANALFAHLRSSGEVPNDVLWTPRDFLLNQSGGKRKVQGTIRQGASQPFLHVESLGCDFHLSKGERWPDEGEVVNTLIRFSFAGPTAIQA